MKLLPEGFCIDTTEVTRDQYQQYLARDPDPEAQDELCSWNDSFEPDESCLASEYACQTDCGDHPQICVDWCDASAYCRAVGKRLCGQIGGGSAPYDEAANATKHQWYAACTSGGQYYYPYGGTDPYGWDKYASLCNGAAAPDMTVPSGSDLGCVSPDARYAGVYDLSGNVWEWTDSCNGSSADAHCLIRGGSFVECFGPGVQTCDYQQNDDACYYGANMARNVVRPNTGFRCCSE